MQSISLVEDWQLLCSQAGFGATALGFSGLVFDAIGFVILGLDLYRLQAAAAAKADLGLKLYTSGLHAREKAMKLEAEMRAKTKEVSKLPMTNLPETHWKAIRLLQEGEGYQIALVLMLVANLKDIGAALIEDEEGERRSSKISLGWTELGIVLVAVGLFLQAAGAAPWC